MSRPERFTASGSSVNVQSFTAPRTPCAAPIRATQICDPGINWPHPSRRAQVRAPQHEGIVPHAEEYGECRASRSTRSRTSLTLRRLGGGFGLRFALLARHGLFRIAARGALCHAGGIEEARHPVRGLRALGKPGLDLVHVELQPRLVVLRQQRIEMPEPLDEAAVARKARIGDDDVIDRALLGACARKADNN